MNEEITYLIHRNPGTLNSSGLSKLTSLCIYRKGTWKRDMTLFLEEKKVVYSSLWQVLKLFSLSLPLLLSLPLCWPRVVPLKTLPSFRQCSSARCVGRWQCDGLKMFHFPQAWGRQVIRSCVVVCCESAVSGNQIPKPQFGNIGGDSSKELSPLWKAILALTKSYKQHPR